MNCDLYKDSLPLYASGDLGPPESERLAQHLDVCPTCRAEYEKLTEIVAVLAPTDSERLTDSEKLRMENEVYRRLAQKANRNHQQRKTSVAARVILRVAAALLLFILGYSTRSLVSGLYEGPHATARVLRTSGSSAQYEQALASGLRFSSHGLKAIAGDRTAMSSQSD
jgi:anti-sigma factor RsiW